MSVVERFLQWKNDNRPDNFGFSDWMGNTFDSDVDTLHSYMELQHRINQEWEYNMILLGGIKHRSESEMRDWLQERQAIGCRNLIASFMGYGHVHDQWNKKKGNFDFQMMSLSIGKELGMHLVERMFFTRSTLLLTEGLLDRLDAIGGDAECVGYLLFYSGLARRFEDDRVTNEILDSQSDRIKAVYRGDRHRWKSEADWVKIMREDSDDDEKDAWLALHLTDANIDRIESMSCDEIVEDLTLRTKAAYHAIPSRRELCEQYSDPANEKIYMFRWDMESRWLDRYLQQYPTDFERELTHIGR
jgi:hypothetical protein